ncbi:hypothetical protein B9Z55_007137 [Caenorhabditis nigoni]|nr:hypothetical protein B9Z55_007137 [Caenorhabditis nigoni]
MEVLQGVIGERDRLQQEVIALTHEKNVAKQMYQGNMRLVTSQRDMAKDIMVGLESQIKEHKKEMGKAIREIKGKEKEEGVLRNQVKFLRDALNKENLKKKEAFEKGRRSVEREISMSNSYDSLHTAEARKRRIEKALTLLESVAGEDCTADFYKDLLKQLDNKNLFKSTFSDHETFQIYHELGFSREKLAKLKSWYRDLGMIDPFSSLHEVKKLEKEIGSSSLYTITPKEVMSHNGDKKTVTVCQMNNIQAYANMCVQRLVDSEKLILDDISNGISVAISVDKGGNDVKLCMSIADVSTPNSCRQLIPLGIYNNDESAEKIKEHLGEVVNQINNFTDVTIKVDGEDVKIPVSQFLVADLKLIYDCLGHTGGSSTYCCPYCFFKSRQKIGNHEKGKDEKGRDCPLRTEQSYKDLSRLIVKDDRMNVKFNSEFLFKLIPLSHVVPASMHVVNGCAQIFGLNVLKQWVDDQESLGSLPKKSRKLEKETQKQKVEIEQKIVQTSNALKDLALLKKIYTKIDDGKTVTSRSSKTETCATEMCVFIDNDSSQLLNRTTIECHGCGGKAHAVCCGIWSEDEYLMTRDPSVVVQCWSCEGVAVRGIIQLCDEQSIDLKNVQDELQESFKFVDTEFFIIVRNVFRDLVETNDYRTQFWKGNGLLRKELENGWKRNGADMCAFKQDFDGNHIAKLLKPESIDDYCSVFTPSSKLESMKSFLIHLGKIQQLCVARDLNAEEMDEMDACINICWERVREFAEDMNMTPKLHILVEHVMPYVRRFRTLGKMSEQSIESFHALYNRLQDRFKSIRNDSTRYSHCFRVLLFFNYVSMNS